MIYEISENGRNVKLRYRVTCAFFAVSLALSIVIISFVGVVSQPADAARFILRVEEDVYTPGESVVIYGAGAPNDLLVVRMFDASGRAIKIDNVLTDDQGFFRQAIYEWQEPSASIPFGSYTIEAISSLQSTDVRTVEVTFAVATQVDTGQKVPITHTLGVKLDSPDQVSVNESFRIFIQVTFDGALVAVEEEDAVSGLLAFSHIHSGNSTITLSDKLRRLHEGLYFADVTLEAEGAYIIHSVAFHRGLVAHDSKVISATSTSIGTIQESVRELDARLDSTNRELAELQRGIQETRGALNQTQTAITESVVEAREGIGSDIDRVQQASGQINSIILPVLALISVIIALQISLFARIRASFR
jgi:hypothetical protein